MTHNTIAVYLFVEKLITDYVKFYLPQLPKIHYLSDGSCAQYKNYKNFANLIFHVQDFGITAEWNLFATSSGRIHVMELEGLSNVLLQGQVYKGHWITKS